VDGVEGSGLSSIVTTTSSHVFNCKFQCTSVTIPLYPFVILVSLVSLPITKLVGIALKNRDCQWNRL
jgi:hypothetical protein